MEIVSVCMATYNGEKYIYQQAKSILDQLSPNDELIVSDDGSTDGTLKVLEDFNDYRIKIYKNTGMKGPVGNFQNGLAYVTGDYIFLADQDDIWFDTKIKTMVALLKEYDLVICDCSIVDDSLNVIKPSYFEHANSGAGFLKNFKRNTYMGNCMGFRKKMLPLILPFPPAIPNHDLWIGVVADLFYKPYFLKEVLGMHRRHEKNASNTFDVKIKTSFWQKINKRVLVGRALPKLLAKKLRN
ncbi:glycosyltransferase family 2 protein [uncultured Mucilaginibacter sp.]|uniref:glycosyltransferase family 2 protein n=1 Tax=uncultured Mucilaginibacter sp. TaxID=797541 RepID=UPI0025CF4C8B|nr:glycosyltransferase family 2 protein [uncultured Mucilaginibacter sp.]